MESEYDVVVVGGGLAALTAGLFAARCGRSTLVLAPGVPGGHLATVETIEDFPGFPGGVAGYELGPLVQEQAEQHGAQFSLEAATGLETHGGSWRVRTDEATYQARAVVVATGSHPRALDVPGEARLRSSGVSHCASCDGPLLRGRAAAVVGGGDSALQEALVLATFASTVYLIHQSAQPTAQRTYQARVEATPTIDVRRNSVVEEIVGDDAVSGVRTRDTTTDASEQLDVAGVFVYVGLAPNSQLLRDLVRLDPEGRIPTDLGMRTERPGLLAAGDVRSQSASQAITAAGDGATAALAAHRYLLDGSWRGS